MATTLYDPAAGFKSYVLQSRTDAAGAAVDDADGEDLRTVLDAFYTEGIVTPAAAFQVTEDSPTGMTVLIGSGSAKSDHCLIDGDIAGQGAYLARMEDATVTLTVPAADSSNPRIDEVYLVVQDNAYDSSSRVLPRIAYRDGTAGTSPSAPGPDAAWEAFMLVATINVGAGVTEITNSDITDERPLTGIALAGSDRLAVLAADDSTLVEVPSGGQLRVRIGGTDAFRVGGTQANLEGREIVNVGDVDGVDVSEHSHDGTDSTALATGSVDTTQIADSAVTTPKLGSNSVDTAQLAPDAVTQSRIADEAVLVARLVDQGAFLVNNFEVDGSTEVASQALTSSFADVASVSLSIPAGWGSWKCEAWASYRGFAGSTGAYSTLIQIDGTNQGVKGVINVPIGEGHDGSVGGRRTGITTTGSRTVKLRAREDSGDMSLTDIYLYARAVRTS